MLRVISKIVIGQQPSADFPTRKSTLTFDFCHEYKFSNGWKDLTDKGTVILPKNIYVVDQTGKRISLGSYYGKPPSTINIGGFSTGVPLLLKNDTITIEHGYRYFNQGGMEITEMHQIFDGFISNVKSKKPIEFEIEDAMFKLKQIRVNPATFSANQTLESILQKLLSETPYSVNTFTKTHIGAFAIGNENVSDVLQRLREKYYLFSYFRGNELRCGSQVYIESEAVTQTFSFQQNIIEDELEYVRKDDMQVSVIASNSYEQETGKLTKDGYAKTKRVRLEVLVTYLPDGTLVKYVKKKREKYPASASNSVCTHITAAGITTIEGLVLKATPYLDQLHYTGFRGKFTTFGIPFVRQGDNARIIDPILPERNGLYKIKEVEYSGGVSGLRQIVHLHYKIQ